VIGRISLEIRQPRAVRQRQLQQAAAVDAEKGLKNVNSVVDGLLLRAATQRQVPFRPSGPSGRSLANRRLPRASQAIKDARAALISSSVLPMPCSRPV